MTITQIKSLMHIAAANGDMVHYKRLEKRLEQCLNK